MNTSVFCQEIQTSCKSFLRIPILSGDLEGRHRTEGVLHRMTDDKGSLIVLLEIMIKGGYFDVSKAVSIDKLRDEAGFDQATLDNAVDLLEKVGLLKSVEHHDGAYKNKYCLTMEFTIGKVSEIIRLVPELNRYTLIGLSPEDIKGIADKIKAYLKLQRDIEELKNDMARLKTFTHDCTVKVSIIVGFPEHLLEEMSDKGSKSLETIKQFEQIGFEINDKFELLRALYPDINMGRSDILKPPKDFMDVIEKLKGIEAIRHREILILDEIEILVRRLLYSLIPETKRTVEHVESNEFFVFIENASESLSHMIEGYFHKEEIDRDIDLSFVLKEIAKEIKGYMALGNSGIANLSINIDIREGEWVIAMFSSQFKSMLIENSLLNAAQVLNQHVNSGWMKEQGRDPVINVTIEKKDGNLILKIIDNGPGIDIAGILLSYLKTKGDTDTTREDIEDILSNYKMAKKLFLVRLGVEEEYIENPESLVFKSDVTARKGGTGSGLKTAYDFCEKYGFEISVRNSDLDGLGAEFTIIIPKDYVCSGNDSTVGAGDMMPSIQAQTAI